MGIIRFRRQPNPLHPTNVNAIYNEKRHSSGADPEANMRSATIVKWKPSIGFQKAFLSPYGV